MLTAVLGGFVVVGLSTANPMGVVFGLPGDLLYPYDSMGLKITPLYIALLFFSLTYGIISSIYYSLLDSGGRRTIGKRAMHLETLSLVKGDPNLIDAFLRNMVRVGLGMVGAYLLGIVGANLAVAAGLYIDYTSGSGKKADIRQRSSDMLSNTMVLLESDEVEPGEMAVDGAPTIDDLIDKERQRRAAERARRMKAPKVETARKVSARTEEDGPGIGTGFSGGFSKGHGRTPSEAKEEEPLKKPEKQGFGAFTRSPAPASEEKGAGSEPKGPGMFSKLFGGSAGKKEKEGSIPEASARKELTASAPVEIPSPATAEGAGKERDRTVLSFMIEFDIDEERARRLYDTGYRKVIDLSDAIPQDLISIKGINPTIARRIIDRAKRGT